MTVTASGTLKLAPTGVDWGVVFGLTVIEAGSPAVFVSVKFSGGRPGVLAVTVYGPPATLFAVAFTLACPFAAVVTGLGVLKVAVAPLAGAVKVMIRPGTNAFPRSGLVAVTVSGCGKGATPAWTGPPPLVTARAIRSSKAPMSHAGPCGRVKPR